MVATSLRLDDGEEWGLDRRLLRSLNGYEKRDESGDESCDCKWSGRACRQGYPCT